MAHAAARNRAPDLLFGGIAGGVYVCAVLLARLLPGLEHADRIAIGMTLDMLVVVPLAFYLLIARRRGWPAVATAPVFVLSLVAAARILPATHQQPLRFAEFLAIPAEIGIIGWIAWRSAVALRAARSDRMADPLERVRRTALDLVRHERVAGLLATEIAVLQYGLASWRARPHAPAGAAAFTHHRRSGHFAILGALLMVMGIEGVAVHILVALWSGPAAWALTLLTLYGGLWLLADARATALRPILVDEENLFLRAGLRWSVRVPRAQVAGWSRQKPAFGRECLNLTILGSPTHWIELASPMLAVGPYGIRRRVRAVGIQPDDAAAFDRALGARRRGA